MLQGKASHHPQATLVSLAPPVLVVERVDGYLHLSDCGNQQMELWVPPGQAFALIFGDD